MATMTAGLIAFSHPSNPMSTQDFNTNLPTGAHDSIFPAELHESVPEGSNWFESGTTNLANLAGRAYQHQSYPELGTGYLSYSAVNESFQPSLSEVPCPALDWDRSCEFSEAFSLVENPHSSSTDTTIETQMSYALSPDDFQEVHQCYHGPNEKGVADMEQRMKDFITYTSEIRALVSDMYNLAKDNQKLLLEHKAHSAQEQPGQGKGKEKGVIQQP